MSKEVTVRQIIDRIRNQLGTTWNDSSVDILNTGNQDTLVTGIVTPYMPSNEWIPANELFWIPWYM